MSILYVCIISGIVTLVIINIKNIYFDDFLINDLA